MSRQFTRDDFCPNTRLKCEKQINHAKILIPSLVLFEIYKKFKSKISEDEALAVIASLRAHTVLELTSEIALQAADLSLQYDLAMADSFMLAHAYSKQEPLLTLDNDFANIPGVIVLRK